MDHNHDCVSNSYDHYGLLVIIYNLHMNLVKHSLMSIIQLLDQRVV